MISIIIPVFNEENRLRENLKTISDFLKKFEEKTELLIVDDGSKDKTPEILEELKSLYGFKIITATKNSGKGAAIKLGVKNCGGEKILFTDIDLSVPIDTLDSFNNGMTDEVDIVIGSRELPGSKIAVRQFWLRELAGLMFTLLTNSVLWVGATDFTCGFKLFRKNAAIKIFNKQLTPRWAFDAESLYLARKFNFKIKEMPVEWKHGEGSKVRFPQDLIESFFSLFRIRMNDIIGKYDKP